MRIVQSQPWGVLLALGTLAAVSCTNGGTVQPPGGPNRAEPMPPGETVQPPVTENNPKPVGEDGPPKAEDPSKPNDKPADPGKPSEPDEPEAMVAALQVVANCDEAASFIRDRALDNMNARIDALKKGTLRDFCALPAASAPAGGTPPPSSAGNSAGGGRANSTSMTNNQVAGVDEADFIKNDDKYVYAAMNGALRIIEAWPAAGAKEVSKVVLEGTPKKLFVYENRALVYVSLPRTAAMNDRAPDGLFYANQSECTYGYDCQFGGDGTATALLVFDITDRAAPKQLRRIELSGSLLAARRIGPAVHTVAVVPELQFQGVSYQIPNDVSSCSIQPPTPERDAKWEELRKKNADIISKAPLSNFLPSVKENGVDYGQNDCSALYREVTPTGTAFTSLISLDIAASSEPVVSTVLSKPGAVYASGEALYMGVLSDFPQPISIGVPGFVPAPGQGPSTAERKLTTALHKFRIGPDPKATGYLASGEVKGHVLNQFSMDEHKGNLRVATSWGKVPSPDVHSTMSVVSQREDKLSVVGMVDRIAPSEDIRSVRFDGDRGFIVTFKKTDPLYAFDLSDPSAPKITGELKIPGFSTYMHMLDDGHLLTIGYDAADQGDFAFFTGVLLQIFDVRDPANLKLAHKISIGTRGTSSEALTNHLAFTLFEGKLAVPMTICEGGDSNGGFGSMMTFSGLMLFDVSVTDGLRERGRVAHPGGTGVYDSQGCSNWWTRASSVVQRSVFMEDFVYSIAQDVMRVQNVDALGEDVAAVGLKN